jgi:hypothetical protein
MVDIFLLADKYDIPNLRQHTTCRLNDCAYREFQNLDANNPSRDDLVDFVARICGPDSFQCADNAMKTRVMEICQENCISLFQNKTFLRRYTKGELFDVESAAAFGMELGHRLLKSKGIAAKEADGFPKTKLSTKDYHYQLSMRRYNLLFMSPGVPKLSI